MVDIKEKIKPVSEKHSIKEVVISLFLSEPIEEPEKFRDLLDTTYKDIFQKFTPVSSFQVQFKKDGNEQTTQFSQQDNAGFKFIANAIDGRAEKILQGINEPKRTFISYHTFNYDRWNTFLNEYQKTITALAEAYPGFCIIAFSLHYIDELQWIDKKEALNKNLILKKGTEKIPGDFFKARKPVFSLVSEREKQESIYYERLEVRIDQSTLPVLAISHNVTENLSEKIRIDQLFNSQFKQKLDTMHSYNKEMLAEILTDEVQNLIGLK